MFSAHDNPQGAQMGKTRQERRLVEKRSRSDSYCGVVEGWKGGADSEVGACKGWMEKSRRLDMMVEGTGSLWGNSSFAWDLNNTSNARHLLS